MKIGSSLKNIFLLIISIIFSVIFMEVIIRLFFEISGKKRLFKADPVIGWIPKENVKYTKKLLSSTKREYKVNYSTDNNGFRFISEKKGINSKSNPRKRILVIGDSFTGGLYSSDDKSWFAYLDEGLNLDVFAYGIPGSGTLQQWLVYKNLKKIIKPDILLIQACTNDIFNDSLEYSYKTISRNQALRAPYLKDEKIYYRDEIYVKIYRFLLNRSNFFYLVDYQLSVLQSKFFNVKDLLNDENLDKAIANWEKIYSNYINEVKNDGVQEIWSVNCGSSIDPRIEIKNFNTWISSSKKNDLRIFVKPNDKIYQEFLNNKDVYVLGGGHLSDIGNKIFGKSLVEEIKLKKINILNN